MRASRGHQDTLRKYLLGDLEEPARVALDEQVITDPAQVVPRARGGRAGAD